VTPTGFLVDENAAFLVDTIRLLACEQIYGAAVSFGAGISAVSQRRVA
jgi:hypothetical protein